MANPTSKLGDGKDYSPAILVTGGSKDSVTLDLNKSYLLSHNGVQADGSTGDTALIQCSVDDTDPNPAAGTERFLLLDGEPIMIGPGISTLTFKSGGTPTFSVIPQRDTFGDW